MPAKNYTPHKTLIDDVGQLLETSNKELADIYSNSVSKYLSLNKKTLESIEYYFNKASWRTFDKEIFKNLLSKPDLKSVLKELNDHYCHLDSRHVDAYNLRRRGLCYGGLFSLGGLLGIFGAVSLYHSVLFIIISLVIGISGIFVLIGTIIGSSDSVRDINRIKAYYKLKSILETVYKRKSKRMIKQGLEIIKEDPERSLDFLKNEYPKAIDVYLDVVGSDIEQKIKRSRETLVTIEKELDKPNCFSDEQKESILMALQTKHERLNKMDNSFVEHKTQLEKHKQQSSSVVSKTSQYYESINRTYRILDSIKSIDEIIETTDINIDVYKHSIERRINEIAYESESLLDSINIELSAKTEIDLLTDKSLK